MMQKTTIARLWPNRSMIGPTTIVPNSLPMKAKEDIIETNFAEMAFFPAVVVSPNCATKLGIAVVP
jgi:hypothetical protein